MPNGIYRIDPPPVQPTPHVIQGGSGDNPPFRGVVPVALLALTLAAWQPPPPLPVIPPKIAPIYASLAGIDFDSASSSGYQTGVSSYNWNHTTSGSNRELIVEISMLAGSSVVSITYNSVPLTQIRSDVQGPDRVEMWGLTNPDLGTHAIAVVVTGTVTSIGNASSYVNVDQTTSVVANHGSTGTSTTAADSVTTIEAGDWVVGGLSTVSTTATSSDRERSRGSGVLGIGAIADEGPIASPSSQSITWTGLGVASTWAVGTVVLKPLSAAPPPTSDTVLVTRPPYAQLQWWGRPAPPPQQNYPSIVPSLPPGGDTPPRLQRRGSSLFYPWLPAPPAQPRQVKTPQEVIAAAQPAFTRVPGAIASWWVAPAYRLPRSPSVVPTLPAGGDQPPPRTDPSQRIPGQAWAIPAPLPQQRIPAPPATPAVVNDPQPQGRPWLNSVLASWRPAPWSGNGKALFVPPTAAPPVVNNPPPHRLGELDIILEWWKERRSPFFIPKRLFPVIGIATFSDLAAVVNDGLLAAEVGAEPGTGAVGVDNTQSAVFGPYRTGLTTVGLQFRKADATAVGPRITAGITEGNPGTYTIDYPPPSAAAVADWDTGDATPVHAMVDVNTPQTGATQFLFAGFGRLKAGLLTVGYQLNTSLGVPIGGRVTTGIVDFGEGYYGATATVSAVDAPYTVWDDGLIPPILTGQGAAITNLDVDFGPTYAGLTTVGFQFRDAAANVGSRITTGVLDGGDGVYSVSYSVPATAAVIDWDTGLGQHAMVDVNETMSNPRFELVGFGADRTGLLTVGYQLQSTSGGDVGPRVTTGIVEFGFGYYAAMVTVPSGVATILWDDGLASPRTASAPLAFPASADHTILAAVVDEGPGVRTGGTGGVPGSGMGGEETPPDGGGGGPSGGGTTTTITVYDTGAPFCHHNVVAGLNFTLSFPIPPLENDSTVLPNSYLVQFEGGAVGGGCFAFSVYGIDPNNGFVESSFGVDTVCTGTSPFWSMTWPFTLNVVQLIRDAAASGSPLLLPVQNNYNYGAPGTDLCNFRITYNIFTPG